MRRDQLMLITLYYNSGYFIQIHGHVQLKNHSEKRPAPREREIPHLCVELRYLKVHLRLGFGQFIKTHMFQSTKS